MLDTGWGHRGASLVDIYVDNKFKGQIKAPDTYGFDKFVTYSVGPFPVSGGVHAIVVAFPDLPATGYHDPTGFQRFRGCQGSGCWQSNRPIDTDGFFKPKQPLNVTLKAEVVFGTIKPYIEEYLPPGLTVTNISDGGKFVNNIVSLGFGGFLLIQVS